MELLVLLGLAALVVGLLCIVQWLKTRCPSCRKPWRETGQVQGGQYMAGRNAYLKEWHCPACGYSEWIKSY